MGSGTHAGNCKHDVGMAVTDACVWEKRRPDTGELIKKPTKIIGTPEVVSAIDFRCDGRNDHSVVEGAMHCPTSDGGWKRMAVSDWAGGYTEEFSVALLRGVREAVATRSASRSSSQVVHHNVSFPTAVHPTPSGEPAVWGPSAATDRTS